jgi:hypothetical protein
LIVSAVTCRTHLPARFSPGAHIVGKEPAGALE